MLKNVEDLAKAYAEKNQAQYSLLDSDSLKLLVEAAFVEGFNKATLLIVKQVPLDKDQLKAVLEMSSNESL